MSTPEWGVSIPGSSEFSVKAPFPPELTAVTGVPILWGMDIAQSTARAGQPWERQMVPPTEESSRAYAAFCVYRDLGPHRSLIKAAAIWREPGGQKAVTEPTGDGTGRRRVPKSIETWSRSWKWPERARAWDDEQDRVRRESFMDEVGEMGRRQAQQAGTAGEVLMQPILVAANRLESIQGELELMPLVKLLKLAAVSARVLPRLHDAEREARRVITGAVFPAPRPEPVAQQAAEPALIIRGVEFVWVQGRCTCGHPHSLHDQTHSSPAELPCTADGCGCRRYCDADEAEANGQTPV